MKNVLLDHVCPIGHSSLINFYIDNISKKFDKIILNKNIKDNIIKKKKIEFLDFKKSFVIRIYNLIKLFKNFKKNKVYSITMLSYEPLVLIIINIFCDLKNMKLFVFEHDNLNKKKPLKLFFIKILNKKIIHLTYSEPAYNFLKKKLLRRSKLIDHPIIKYNFNFEKDYKNINIKEKTILIPTRHHYDESLIKKIVRSNPRINFLILLKGSNIKKKKFDNFQNVSTLEKISDRDLNKINSIYLPLKNNVYDFRVSAWVYRGIGFNKKIILDNNILYKFEKKKFPNYIFKNTKNIKNILTKNLKNSKNILFTKNYNRKLIKEFNNLPNLYWRGGRAVEGARLESV